MIEKYTSISYLKHSWVTILYRDFKVEDFCDSLLSQNFKINKEDTEEKIIPQVRDYKVQRASEFL